MQITSRYKNSFLKNEPNKIMVPGTTKLHNDIKAVNIYQGNYTSSCMRLDNFFLQYVKMAKIKLYC